MSLNVLAVEATRQHRNIQLDTGIFMVTGSMAVPRELHAATALQDGRVLIAGGIDSGSITLASAEVYDPVTGLFTST